MSPTMDRLTLTPDHRKTLIRSAIAPDVAHERPYCSVKKDDPRLAPFAEYQRADGLLIAHCPPDGTNGRYQLRRDQDRVRRDGSKAKYEQAAGQSHRLDVHPRAQRWLKDPRVPLCVTEGIKKGDALVSAGCCAVALGGVWCFRKECIPDWDLIELEGRTVIIVFDSDAESNPQVAMARDELARFLTGRGAIVKIVRLPHGPNGEKLGIDDYLGLGGNLVDLLAQYLEPWRVSATGSDGAQACRKCTEYEALARAETEFLLSPTIKHNRKVPHLLWIRRYWSDRTRATHPEAAEGDPAAWQTQRPLVDEDGWDRVPAKAWEAQGLTYAVMRKARDELIAQGVFEAREEEERLADGQPVKRTLVRPKAASSLLETVRSLVTIVPTPSDWGGARDGAGRKQAWQCPSHPAAKVKRVCTVCGEDAELVDLPMNQDESWENPTPPPSPPPSSVNQDESWGHGVRRAQPFRAQERQNSAHYARDRQEQAARAAPSRPCIVKGCPAPAPPAGSSFCDTHRAKPKPPPPATPPPRPSSSPRVDPYRRVSPNEELPF